MASLDMISAASTGLTEAMKIYADIKGRQQKQAAQQSFLDKLQAAGGVENLSTQDLMEASNVLAPQQFNLANQAIQQKRKDRMLEATRVRNAESLIEERKYERGVRQEDRGYTAGLLTDKIGRDAAAKAAKITREDELTKIRNVRTDQLKQEGRSFSTSERIARQEYETAKDDDKRLRETTKVETATADKDEALAGVNVLVQKYGAIGNIPKIELMPFAEELPALKDYLKPKRIVGKPGEAPGQATAEINQTVRDLLIVDGDEVGARRLLTEAGLHRTSRNAMIKSIRKDVVKVRNAEEVLAQVDDIMELPDDAFGVGGQSKDILSSIMGSLGFEGKPSVFRTKMASLTADYAKEKLKGTLSDKDMKRIEAIVGDSGLLRSGPGEARQTLGEIQDILVRSIEQLRTGKAIKPTRTAPSGVVEQDIELTPEQQDLINKYGGNL